MSEHYIVAVDAGHLRIYAKRCPPGQQTAAFDPVEAMDFPLGVAGYNERDTDQAGRYPGSQHQAAAPGAPAAGSAGTSGRNGMSIDERLPMKREEGKRRARDIAEKIQSFFEKRPAATWDFAAGGELNHAVLEQLTPQVRGRLRQCLSKDLVNQGAAALRTHFAAA